MDRYHWAWSAHVVKPRTLRQALSMLQTMDVDPAGAAIMAPKALHLSIRLKAVPLKAAVILKQEMLAKGGEGAYSRRVAALTCDETDMLLTGTVKQLKAVARTLSAQPFGLKYLGVRLQQLLEGVTEDQTWKPSRPCFVTSYELNPGQPLQHPAQVPCQEAVLWVKWADENLVPNAPDVQELVDGISASRCQAVLLQSHGTNAIDTSEQMAASTQSRGIKLITLISTEMVDSIIQNSLDNTCLLFSPQHPGIKVTELVSSLEEMAGYGIPFAVDLSHQPLHNRILLAVTSAIAGASAVNVGDASLVKELEDIY